MPIDEFALERVLSDQKAQSRAMQDDIANMQKWVQYFQEQHAASQQENQQLRQELAAAQRSIAVLQAAQDALRREFTALAAKLRIALDPEGLSLPDIAWGEEAAPMPEAAATASRPSPDLPAAQELLTAAQTPTADAPQERPAPAAASFGAVPPEQAQRMERCRREYNILPGASEETRGILDAFLRRYGIVAFSCADAAPAGDAEGAEERAPVFRSASDVTQAQYWAMPLGGGCYAAFPRSRILYDRALHATMRAAFESNYHTGAYDSIEVVRPALFLADGDAWQLDTPGRLRLR